MNNQLLQLWNDHRSVRRLLLNRFQAALQADGLSPAQSELLFTIFKHHHSPVTPGLLAAELHLTPGAVSQLLDGLEQADYIKRVHSEEDRRICLVTMCDTTSAKVQRLKNHQRKLVAEVTKLLDPSEIDTLIKAQQKLIAYLRQQPLETTTKKKS